MHIYMYTYMYAGPAPAISHLGIKPYQWGTECLSGDVIAGPATSFPQSIGMVYGYIHVPYSLTQCIPVYSYTLSI